MHRTTITLDAEAYAFLMASSEENKSSFINQLLKKEKLRKLEEEIYRANIQEAEDEVYQAELGSWDETLIDGLS